MYAGDDDDLRYVRKGTSEPSFHSLVYIQMLSDDRLGLYGAQTSCRKGLSLHSILCSRLHISPDACISEAVYPKTVWAYITWLLGSSSRIYCQMICQKNLLDFLVCSHPILLITVQMFPLFLNLYCSRFSWRWWTFWMDLTLKVTWNLNLTGHM